MLCCHCPASIRIPTSSMMQPKSKCSFSSGALLSTSLLTTGSPFFPWLRQALPTSAIRRSLGSTRTDGWMAARSWGLGGGLGSGSSSFSTPGPRGPVRRADRIPHSSLPRLQQTPQGPASASCLQAQQDRLRHSLYPRPQASLGAACGPAGPSNTAFSGQRRSLQRCHRPNYTERHPGSERTPLSEGPLLSWVLRATLNPTHTLAGVTAATLPLA